MPHLALKLAAATAGAVAWGAFWRAYYRAPLGSTDVHHAPTDDGWFIALTRYRASTPERTHPVILCHGMAANRTSFDLDPKCSLARHLAASGFDVWSLELRGHGLSDRPRLGSARSYGWNFSDHVHRDVPAAIDYVLRRTGRPRVHWIGHSMGGVILYAHLALTGGENIRSAITVGSGLDYSSPSSRFHGLEPLRKIALALPALPLGIAALMIAPLTGRFGGPLDRFNIWPSNVDPALVRRLHATTFHAISPPVLFELGSALAQGGLRAPDGKPYLDALPGVRVPVLALAGDRDRQCPPEVARIPIDALGPPSEIRFFGPEHGSEDHYGHFDLLIGKRAVTEVYGEAVAWLEKHDAAVEPITSAAEPARPGGG